MKQSLQLKLGQQLKMTPQLQQAIRLLQLSTLDLQQEIQEAIDSNPMLEVVEDHEQDKEESEKKQESTEPAPASEQEQPSDDINDAFDKSEQWQDEIPSDLSLDTHWDEIYQPQTPAINNNSAEQDADFDYKNTRPETLHDHLYWQLNLTSLVDSDRAIALAIIDSVNPNGFLSSPAQELFDSIKNDVNIEFEEFEAVRQLIMAFDPIGVGSESLQECLALQLSQMPPNTPFANDAKVIVTRHINILANHDYAQLKRKTRFKEGRLKEAIALILSLNPCPGDIIDSTPTEYITPDVFVKKAQGQWVVELNQDCSPSLKINADYASLVKRADNSEDNNYLKNNLQEAKWFIKSLQSRNDTLFKVACKIVEHQMGFLEFGEEAMKPLILHDISESIDMHESTISRVTTRKYIHTPRGVFELKYFFSSHVSTHEGGECSSTAIKAIIKKSIGNENKQKPLSDSKISALLTEQGINVARRTVAKYRESMTIPPSNERKRLT